jgi:non-ribosomal peptide synthetase component F
LAVRAAEAHRARLTQPWHQEVLLVGTAIANRTRAETEGMIGPFANTLLMRADLSDNPTFQELLARTRAVALEAYAHQDLPFEHLVEALQVERDLSRNPLFQVLFGLHNTPAPGLSLPGLTIKRLEAKFEGTRFDLSLDLWETAEGLAGMVQYSTDLFEAATIRRFIAHFQTLLESIVADPAQRLSQLPLLTDAESRQMLIEWNATQATYPQERCVHQLFESQAEQTPDAVAVVFDDGVGAKHSIESVYDAKTSSSNASPLHITYAELNHRANQLAYYLRGLGVGSEVRVGVCLERSLEMVIGLLGVLKAGGAYVPLDPSYPPERLAYMLEDSQARVLVTESKQLAAQDARLRRRVGAGRGRWIRRVGALLDGDRQGERPFQVDSFVHLERLRVPGAFSSVSAQLLSVVCASEVTRQPCGACPGAGTVR